MLMRAHAHRKKEKKWAAGRGAARGESITNSFQTRFKLVSNSSRTRRKLVEKLVETHPSTRRKLVEVTHSFVEFVILLDEKIKSDGFPV